VDAAGGANRNATGASGISTLSAVSSSTQKLVNPIDDCPGSLNLAPGWVMTKVTEKASAIAKWFEGETNAKSSLPTCPASMAAIPLLA